MNKEPMNPTNLRTNLYKVMDEIIRTGEPVNVLRNGYELKLELNKKHNKKDFWDRLEPHPNCLTPGITDEDLINVPSEWNYDFS